MWPDKQLFQYFKNTMLKFSSPLRRDHNEDDNKENILSGQGIPKNKSVDDSCTSTLPILPENLNNKQINISLDDLDVYESPLSSPELRISSNIKSFQPSDVKRSVSPGGHFEQNHSKTIYQNGILDKEIADTEIEFDVNSDVTSRQGDENCTFIGEKIPSEYFLNSTFDVEDGVNGIVKTLERNNGQESLNSTINIPSDKSGICVKEITLNTESKSEPSDTFKVCPNLNISAKLDVKKQINQQELIISINSDDSDIESKTPTKNLCSDKDCVQIENHKISDSVVESEDEKLLEVDIDLEESCREESDKSELTIVYNSPNQGIAEFFLNEDTIQLKESFTDSKEVLQDPLVLAPENIEKNSLTSDQSNSNLESCNIILLTKNCEGSQIIKQPEEKQGSNLSEFHISQVGNSLESKQNLNLPKCTENEIATQSNENNVKLEDQKDSNICVDLKSISALVEAENTVIIGDQESLSSDSQFENNAASQLVECSKYPAKVCVDTTPLGASYHSEVESSVSEYLINSDNSYSNDKKDSNICVDLKSVSALVEAENSVIIGDQEPSSGDSQFENKAADQIVQCFEYPANTCVDTTPLGATHHSEVESSEYFKNSDKSYSNDKSKENIVSNEEATSDNGKSDFTALSSPKPQEGIVHVSELENPGFQDSEEPKENQVSTVAGEKEVLEVCRSSKLDESNEVVLNNIDVDTAEKNECVQDLTKSDQEQIDNKSSNVPKISESDIRKMSEINEQLQQEISDLKLELNAAKQAKATLELEIGKKDAIILMTQAESIKKEQQSQHDIKLLREQLKEKSSINEKDAIKELEEALKESRTRESQAVTELNARTVDVLNYRKIMEEYEKTIATRFADYQKLKEENQTVTRHLANLELSFSDLHQKYERTKTIIYGLKNNEDKLRQSLATCEDSIHKQEERYESLKAHAKAQIEKSNKEIIRYKEKYDIEVNKLNAIIKRLEIKSASLETSLDQKTKECIALAALCDEVTGKKV